jgi:endogenous inhibitor of DNA gyrase (YacG/DUF329 family)
MNETQNMDEKLEQNIIQKSCPEVGKAILKGFTEPFIQFCCKTQKTIH